MTRDSSPSASTSSRSPSQEMETESSQLTTGFERRRSIRASSRADSTSVQISRRCADSQTAQGHHTSQQRCPNLSNSSRICHQCSPNTSRHQQASPKNKIDETLRLTRIRYDDPNVNCLSSNIFIVIQADSADSEGFRFNTGRAQATKDHRKNKRNKYAGTQATDTRKLEVQICHMNFQTRNRVATRIVSEFLPLGCLSILRQEETGLLDQDRSQSRENTCSGRQRDKVR